MQNKHSLYIILAAVLWGIIGVYTRILSNGGFSSQGIVFVRALGAALVLGTITAIGNKSVFRIKLADIKYFIGTGIISFTLFNFCYFTSINQCSLAVAVILLYTSPIFVVLLSSVFFKERLTSKKLIALALTVLGCCCVTGVIGGELQGTLFGIICGIGSGFFYGLYSIFGRYALQKYSSETTTLYTFIFAALGAIVTGGLHGMEHIPLTPQMIIAAILLVILSTVTPFLLYTKGLEGVESGSAAIMASIEPIVGVLVGVFVVKDSSLSFINIAGIVLIISAILILNIRGDKNGLQRNN